MARDAGAGRAAGTEDRLAPPPGSCNQIKLLAVPPGEWPRRERHGCPECPAREGELHAPGCPLELCALCLRALGTEDGDESCQCDEELGLPERDLEARRTAAGRIPFVATEGPQACHRCGKVWPELFMADDWPRVLPRNLREAVLCLECYKLVRQFLGVDASRDEITVPAQASVRQEILALADMFFGAHHWEVVDAGQGDWCSQPGVALKKFVPRGRPRQGE